MNIDIASSNSAANSGHHQKFGHLLELINNCDESEPLLSETQLGQCLERIALNQVATGELIQLHQALNVEQLVPTQSGLARDYRGLAELMEFSSAELESRFKRSHNPSKCLIEAYTQRKLADQHQRQLQRAPVSVNHLLKLLEKLERFDIIDDLLPTLIRLAQEEESRGRHRSQHKQLALPPNQNSATLQNVHHHHHHNQQQHGHQQTSGTQQQYDAFVCFAPEDYDYAQELILMLERHNKRLVTVDNLLPGRFEYDALVHMIATECRKVIIILTPNFLVSKECEFQTKFANEIAIKSGWFPKIIPVLYEPFEDAQLPPLIRVISKIDMTNKRANQLQWQLKKLLGSLEYNSNPDPSASNSMHEPRQPTGGAMCQPTLQGFESTYSRLCQLNVEPIIDLAYSQSSDSAMNLSSRLSTMTAATNGSNTTTTSRHDNPFNQISSSSSSGSRQSDSPVPAPGGNNSQLNPMNWYKSFKRRVFLRNDTNESFSSRAILLQQDPPSPTLTTSEDLNDHQQRQQESYQQ